MTSIIKVTSVQDTSGNNETTTANIKKAYDGAAKSYINHDAGTTINDSLNVSSVTDNSTGYHEHSFTSNHANKNYAASGSVIGDSSTQTQSFTYTFIGGGSSAANSKHTTSAINYSCIHHGGTIVDEQMVQVVTHGDLA